MDINNRQFAEVAARHSSELPKKDDTSDKLYHININSILYIDHDVLCIYMIDGSFFQMNNVEMLKKFIDEYIRYKVN